MPYIKVKDREVLEEGLKTLFAGMKKVNETGFVENDNLVAGTLNYIFTRISLEYIKQKGLRYQNLNDVEGALSNCSKEFYRRVSSKYEKECILKNTDLPEFKEII